MHLILGTTTRALAEREALRRELTPGPRRPPSLYTHLLSPELGRDHPEGSLYRALSLGVLAPERNRDRRRR